PAHSSDGPVIWHTGLGVTVTVNEQVARLPHGSCAAQVTIVWPTGNVDPDGGVHFTGTGPAHRSVALDWNVTTLWHSPTVMSSEQVITGAFVSATWIVWLAVELLPQ